MKLSADVPPPAPPAATPPPVDGKRAPDEWAAAKGLFKPGTEFQKENVDWRHAAAACSHGWLEHAHHAGAPIQLSEADYDAALKSVESVDMAPHAPAVSPHSPHAKPVEKTPAK